MPSKDANPLKIWRVVDGKRGHERQTQGLVHALTALTSVHCLDIKCLSVMRACWVWLTGNYMPNLEPPDMIIGAGHATHLTILALKKAMSKTKLSKTVVLMTPSLPRNWFDLCVIPRHDQVTDENVFVTEGSLNAMMPNPNTKKVANQGLILLGGVSKHYQWDTAGIVNQLHKLIEMRPDIDWTLSTSRRTPNDLIPLLDSMRLNVVLCDEVDEYWLPTQLGLAELVWLTPDSVSMLYESMTAGCAVGVFNLEASKKSKHIVSIKKLIIEKKVVEFNDWQTSQKMHLLNVPFNEALRCAQWIKNNWFPNH